MIRNTADGVNMELDVRKTGGIYLPDKILIVEDDEINRMVLSNIFADSYDIIEAENGERGVELLLENIPSICAVLLDVVMPVMDGMRFLEEIHSLGWNGGIPVFLITSASDTDVLSRAYELGVMDVIAKPVVPYMVRRRVDSVIELFKARKRLRIRVEEQQQEIDAQARKIIDLNLGMIEALSTAVEFRSAESGSHVRRIHDITKTLLLDTELGVGLSYETIDMIATAAIMHDVGKIAIPDAILNKPGKLTKEEFEIMKTHTIRGGEFLERIPQLREQEAFKYAYDIARHHHERFDGKGYPDGLKGQEIPLYVQAVSLADVYDALVNDRVYKKAYSFDEAARMIRAGECGSFGPRLLGAFKAAEPKLRSFYQGREA